MEVVIKVPNEVANEIMQKVFVMPRIKQVIQNTLMVS